MPHFSPMSWMFVMVVMYLNILLYLCLFWWMQSSKFDVRFIDSEFISKEWNWK